MAFVGRPVMQIGGPWDFIPEDEFQRRQKTTEQFLKKNNRITRDFTLSTEGAPSVEK